MSLIISIALCIPFALRLALLIRTRIRCINVDAFARGSAKAQQPAPVVPFGQSAAPLVSVLAVIRDASAAASFIRSMQQQSYRSVEVLIAALHPDAQQSIALKKEIAELCRRLIPHMSAFVSARVAGLNAVGMLAGAARGDLLLLVHERVIFSYESIAAAVDALSAAQCAAQCDALAVVPSVSTAFRTSLAYAPAVYAASRMRLHDAGAEESTEDGEYFTLLKAEQYYKYSVGGYEAQASRSARSSARESMQRSAMLLAARENAAAPQNMQGIQGIQGSKRQHEDSRIGERAAPAVARRQAFSSRIVYPLLSPAECAARFAGSFTGLLPGSSAKNFLGHFGGAARETAAALLYALAMLCIPPLLFALFVWQRPEAYGSAYGWALAAVLGLSLASFCVCAASLHYDAKKSGREFFLQFVSRDMPLRLMKGLLKGLLGWATGALALVHIAALLCAKLAGQLLARAFARRADKNVGGTSSKKSKKLKS